MYYIKYLKCSKIQHIVTFGECHHFQICFIDTPYPPLVKLILCDMNFPSSSSFYHVKTDWHVVIFQIWISGATTFELPGRYGSSAEESSSGAAAPKAAPKSRKTKEPKSKKTKKPEGPDAEHVPLGPGKRDGSDGDSGDDLEGLDGLLNLDGDVKKKPSTKSTRASSKKRPASSQKGRKNLEDCCNVQISINRYSSFCLNS